MDPGAAQQAAQQVAQQAANHQLNAKVSDLPKFYALQRTLSQQKISLIA